MCITSDFKCCKCHVYVIHEFRAVCPSEEDHESDRWQPFGRPRWRNSTFIHPISCFLISFVCCWHAFLLVVVDMFNFAHAYRVWVAMQQKVSDSKEVKKVKRWKKLVFSNKKWSVSPLCDLYLKIKTGLWFSFKMFCFAFVFYWIALNLSFYRISFLVASFFLISADFCCYLVIISFIWKKKLMRGLSDKFISLWIQGIKRFLLFLTVLFLCKRIHPKKEKKIILYVFEHF